MHSLVVFEDHGDLADLRHQAGEGVGIGGLAVELVKGAPGRAVRHTPADGVAVGLLADIEHGHALHVDAAGGIGHGERAGDVRVHAVAGDVLADLVDDQQVGVLDADARHIGLGALEERRLLLDDLRGGKGVDLHGLIVGVLQQRHARGAVGALMMPRPKSSTNSAYILEAAGMVRISAPFGLLVACIGEHLLRPIHRGRGRRCAP